MFKVGDRVECVKKYQIGVSVGELGTVLEMLDWGVAVRWDKYNGSRHNCKGLCESGHGWNVPYDNISHYENVIDLGDFYQDIQSVSIMDLIGG